MKITRPLRAAAIETEAGLNQLRYPLIVQPKMDGIRCMCLNGKLYSRTMKPIPNKEITSLLAYITNGTEKFYDGELLLEDTMDYNEVQSFVMSRDKVGLKWKYVCFDMIYGGYEKDPYEKRLQDVYEQRAKALLPIEWRRVPFEIVNSSAGVLAYEELAIREGYEGIILRNPAAKYKQGKATFKENIIYKFKRVADAEAKIIKCNELMHNGNDLDYNDIGYAKRSSHQDNLYPSSMVGSFTVVGINGKYKDKIFEVSCGSMTHQERRDYWKLRAKMPDTTITYKFASNRGSIDAPFEARFKCFRED
jgi:DNA ligase-1